MVRLNNVFNNSLQKSLASKIGAPRNSVPSNKVNNIIKDFLLKETKNGICHPKSLL